MCKILYIQQCFFNRPQMLHQVVQKLWNSQDFTDFPDVLVLSSSHNSANFRSQKTTKVYKSTSKSRSLHCAGQIARGAILNIIFSDSNLYHLIQHNYKVELKKRCYDIVFNITLRMFVSGKDNPAYRYDCGYLKNCPEGGNTNKVTY